MANEQPAKKGSWVREWLLFGHFTKEERGWIMYDWANSAYSAIVSATIFPLFLTVLSQKAGISDNASTAYLGYATSLGFLLCALLAPILGALGDFPGYKKRLFAAFAVIGVVGTTLLAVTSNWLVLLAFFTVSNIGFSASCLLYDSFLIDVTTKERMDLVSSFGYGVGYITGSTIPLIAALVLYQFHGSFGITQETAMRISFVLTAVWWLVFTLPMLRHVQQRHSVPREGGVVRQSFRNMASTFRKIVKNKGLLWYVIAYFFYIDGVGTIIHMATKFGEAKGLVPIDLLLVLMAVQLVAFPFAILYGVLAKKVGTRRMILVGIFTYLVVCLVALSLNSILHFVLLGALVGTAQATQILVQPPSPVIIRIPMAKVCL